MTIEMPVDTEFLDDIVDASTRLPDDRMVTIGRHEDVLAGRVIIKKSVDGCIYIHYWQRSDPDDLHDHPWRSVTLVLHHGFWEVTPEGRFWRAPGDVIFREATDRHRIEIEDGSQPISLFMTGPRVREWYFHTACGLVPGKNQGV